MQYQLKPISDQVVVITGASSGIGRATARLAAQRGASVVLAARQGQALGAIVDEIRKDGGTATWVNADVSSRDDVQGVVAHAVAEFGHIDTWVNNAAATIYGRVMDVPVDDAQQLFQTNFWGTVYGALAAAREMAGRGGSIINVGSMTSERAMPLIGFYSASKHAVKAFTDALRMELEKDGVPISVTLIKPGSIDTPFTEHARNLMDREPALPPPVYSPEVVARAIIECAQTPHRDVAVGASAGMFTAWEHVAPRSLDHYMEATLFQQQKRGRPAGDAGDNLYRAGDIETYRERGTHEGHVMKSSVYTQATLHPVVTIAATAAAVVAVGTGVSRLLRSGD
jgi:NAD(P)-dependent dehydrogenase (short-subunit alcohol dehydrogenase family)